GGSDLESGVELDLQNRNLLGRLVWPTHPPDNRQLALWMPRVDLDILTLLGQLLEGSRPVHRCNHGVTGQARIRGDHTVRLSLVGVVGVPEARLTVREHPGSDFLQNPVRRPLS